MRGQRVGYIRVSRFDQNPERQLERMAVARVFADKASGKDVRRPELDHLLGFLCEGDTLVVNSMDIRQLNNMLSCMSPFPTATRPRDSLGRRLFHRVAPRTGSVG